MTGRPPPDAGLFSSDSPPATRSKTGLRRRLLIAVAAVFGAILLVEGAALVGLERLDSTLSQIQQDSLADSRRMLALAESTSELSRAARRFREVDDRAALSDAETALRDRMRGFSDLARSLPPVIRPANSAPSLAPAIVQVANRLEATLAQLAATATEAIDAHAGLRVAAEDLGLIKTEILPDAADHPTTAIALSLASMALSATDRDEVQAQQAAFLRLLGQDGRPMVLTLLAPLFERRLAVIDVENRQHALIATEEAAVREIASLGRDYIPQLEQANLERQEATRHLLSFAEMAALVVGLAALGMAVLVANAFLRGAIADLTGIAEAMRRLAAGDTTAEAPGTNREDEIGALAEAFGVFKTQVLEREAMQRQLRQAERLEAIGRFTGGIAHDFNNILTAISTNIQLIHESSEPGSPTDQRALRALEAAEGGAAMVQQLLTFGWRRTLEPAPTDIDAVIASLADLLRESFGDAITLTTEPAGDRAPLVALVDPGQLENALINLLFNARDAVGEAGRIRLSAAPTGNGNIHIEVEDNGSGMPPEVLEHIFEPFFTTKPASKGNGLGLATVYGFVRQSGGCIDVRSEVGIGTTVAIDLPPYPRGSLPSSLGKLGAAESATARQSWPE